MRLRRRLLDQVAPVVDIMMQPLAWLAAQQMLTLRRLTPPRAPRSFHILDQMGVYPLIDHFYDPLINLRRLSQPLEAARNIAGLNLDPDAALKLVAGLDGVNDPGTTAAVDNEPCYDPANTLFCPLDAGVLYGMVVRHRPMRIIEVGCGMSTLVIRMALARLTAMDPSYTCDHICIEPYGAAWLERFPVRVLRQTAESCPLEHVETLCRNDILFIDSSHVIRPQGDVLTEVLGWLGRLRSGVLVHIHDIYTPRDYPDALLRTHRFLWNEQYLVEAFLCFNTAFQVLVPLHHLWHEKRSRMRIICPSQERVGRTEPSSLWLRRNG